METIKIKYLADIEKIKPLDFPSTEMDGIDVVRYLNTLPTVDAVEVVRCRDCIHYDFGVCLKIYSDGAVSQYAWQERNEDDFCSYGERKEGDGNG